MTTMNIGRAAAASGVTPKMIRHYERVRLLEPAPRSDAGYRHYGERDVHTLRFIRHSRDLGFSVDQIRSLLGLWRDHERPSRQVKALAMSHLAALEAKEAELRAMHRALDRLIHACHGDDRPLCPILEGLNSSPKVVGADPTASGTRGPHTLPSPRWLRDAAGPTS